MLLEDPEDPANPERLAASVVVALVLACWGVSVALMALVLASRLALASRLEFVLALQQGLGALVKLERVLLA